MFSKRICRVRDLEIGGKNPVRVQTMYDSPIVGADIDELIARIGKLSSMGCDLIRFSYSSFDDEKFFLLSSWITQSLCSSKRLLLQLTLSISK